MPRTPQPRFDKANRSWYVRYKGKKHYLARDHEVAIKRFAEVIGEAPPDASPKSVRRAADLWLRLFSKSDWQEYLIRCWVDFVGMSALSRLSPDHPVEYANHLQTKGGQGPETVRKKVRAAVAVLRWCWSRGYIKFRPEMPKLPRAVRQARDIPITRLKAVWEDLPERARRILTFILETGCRPKEARFLRWEQIDVEKAVCILVDHKAATRTGKHRTIHLSPAALGLLKRTPRTGPWVFPSRNGEPYTKSGLHSILKRRGIRSTYSLRHTFAQHFLNNGGAIDELAALLGHADLSSVKFYAEIRNERLRRVASNLVSPLQVPPPS